MVRVPKGAEEAEEAEEVLVPGPFRETRNGLRSVCGAARVELWVELWGLEVEGPPLLLTNLGDAAFSLEWGLLRKRCNVQPWYGEGT